MKKNIFMFVCSALVCYSCSETSYLQSNEIELAALVQQYEQTKTTEVGKEGDDISQKIETQADKSDIRVSMEKYITELKNRTSIAKEKVTRSAYSTTNRLVGVFKVGSCGNYKELTIHLDCEDSREASSTSGSVGDSYVDRSGNVELSFCLTEANRFYPGGVLLIDHVDYAAHVSGLEIIVRGHDTEDSGSSNGLYSTHSEYNTLEGISKGLTSITSSGAALAWAFPRLIGDIYPKPAPAVGPSGIQYGLLVKQPSSTGAIFCDDEDKRNKNWAKEYFGDTYQRDITEQYPYNAMMLNENTTYYVGVSTDKEKFYRNNAYNFIRTYAQ